MKITSILLVLVLLMIPFTGALAKEGPGNGKEGNGNGKAKVSSREVRLTARDVSGANDIEKAILAATSNGGRPGTIILDGRDGPINYTAPDRSLNIFVSSITVRGENNASITNCDDGVFFEGAAIHDVTVESISFTCTGDGVDTRGEFDNITFANNQINAASNGIVLTGSSKGWNISQNNIRAVQDGIRLRSAENFTISKNDIAGKNGIVLLGVKDMQVKGNEISAQEQGIMLGQETQGNIVQENHISGVRLSGLALEPSVTGNRILANKVGCAQAANCLVVDVPVNVREGNKINGNGYQ